MYNHYSSRSASAYIFSLIECASSNQHEFRLWPSIQRTNRLIWVYVGRIIHKVHFYLKRLNHRCFLFYLETPQSSKKNQQNILILLV